jgi:Fic family protein
VGLNSAANICGFSVAVTGNLNQEKAIVIHTEFMLEESLKTSEIEGRLLERESVRSAILKKLGSEHADPSINTRDVDGLIESLYDSVTNHHESLTHERLHRWQASLFPNGRDERGYPIRCGRYRTEEMRVISQKGNKEVLHYVAPPGSDVPALMDDFFIWFNSSSTKPSLIRAAMAVFWFVSIHPYEDGNGRLCRLIGDLAIAQSQNLKLRIYSISNVLTQDRQALNRYYTLLEACQRGEVPVTEWIEFFLGCVMAAGNHALSVVERSLDEARFWLNFKDTPLNERQRKFLRKFFDNNLEPFSTLINHKKFQKITGHQAIATTKRDMADLVNKQVLIPAEGHEGRNAAYYLMKPDKAH